jgi:hypothetical protein
MRNSLKNLVRKPEEMKILGRRMCEREAKAEILVKLNAYE